MTEKTLPPNTICTIGHSTRNTEEFIAILREYEIEQVVDVRTLPGSKYAPQFNKETLQKNLKTAAISYVHMPGLGGLRRPKRDSPNMGWHNASFRGFADYMLTGDFDTNLTVLIASARAKRTVLLCAEAVPWRCHRSLISDALVIRGITVIHLLDQKHSYSHSVTPWARVRNSHLIYSEESYGKKKVKQKDLEVDNVRLHPHHNKRSLHQNTDNVQIQRHLN